MFFSADWADVMFALAQLADGINLAANGAGFVISVFPAHFLSVLPVLPGLCHPVGLNLYPAGNYVYGYRKR